MIFPLAGSRWRGPRALTVPALTAAVYLSISSAAFAAPNSAFVGNFLGGSISQYTIGAGQLLSPNGTAPAGVQPVLLAATPNGKYIYATNNSDGTVSQYTVGLDGTLTALSPASVATGPAPVGLAVSPDGRNVYVANSAWNGGTGSVSVFNVGTGGALTLAHTVTADLTQPTGISVSPNGASVYVGDATTSGGAVQQIVEFDRASDGSLTPKSTATIPTTVAGYLALALTPDGHNLYVSGSYTTTIDEYSVGTNGKLTAKAVPAITDGGYNVALTVSPDGRNLYAPSCGMTTSAVYQYAIAAGGQLSAMTPASVPTGGSCPEVAWMTADGASLYTPDFGSQTGDVSQFNVSGSGALTPKSPFTVPAGAGAGGIVIPPDQGPTARFTSKPAKAGHASSFNGSGSSDSDGNVVRYDWNFGDGHSLRNGSAKPKHIYKKKGTYTVTLTVTDDSGCSTTQVFTGQTAYCNGTSAATITHRVKVAAVKLSLSVSPRKATAGKTTCFAFRVSSGGHNTSKATVKLAGHTTRTNAHGKAKLCLALKKGRYTARASKKGLVSAASRILITAAAPAFTG